MTQKQLDRLRGKFIVFDGVDGSGKGSQIRLLREVIEKHGIDVILARDPGGTEIGDRIRHVLLDYDLSKMDVRCEALLFMASRAQLLKEIVDPAVAAGKTCLCDRFVSATCAYQGAAGYDPQQVVRLAPFAIGSSWPHLTLVLDVDPKVGFERTNRKPSARRKNDHGQAGLFHDSNTDAMEARPLSFHQKVRRMFQELPAYYPAPVAIVDAHGSVDEVHKRVMEAIANASL